MGNFSTSELQAAQWRDEDPEDTYKLLRRLDAGASGEVWEAENKATGEKVAVKTIPLDDDVMEELQTEIRALSRCNSPYVVRYFGSYKKDDAVWIVMEFADVGSLQDIVQICLEPLSEPEICSVAASVVQGLAYLHELAIIHRDVKAKNILVTSAGRVKLADLGVAAVLESAGEKRRTAIGSPHWLSPECIAEGKSYDGRSDVWSLGITVIELAQMEPPYADLPFFQLLKLIPISKPPTLEDPEGWSPVMNDFLSQCLVRDPDERPTARQLLSHPFIADEITRQQQGIFDVLQNMVRNSLERIEWFRTEGQALLEAAARGEGVDADADGEHDAAVRRALTQLTRFSVGSDVSDRTGGSRISLPKLSAEGTRISLPPTVDKGLADAAEAADRESASAAGSPRPKSRRKSKFAEDLKKRLSFRKSRTVSGPPGARLDPAAIAEALAVDSEEEKARLVREERDRKADAVKDRLQRLLKKYDKP